MDCAESRSNSTDEAHAICIGVTAALMDAIARLDSIGLVRPATLIQHAHDLIQEEIAR
jgi:cytosine/adenosine deaminase-related metal-dependent hydrolase